MTRFGVIFGAMLMCAATTGQAACIVEYKAKMDDPLRLDQGTLTVNASTCTPAGVEGQVRAQLASQGWTLLSIVSVRESG